MKPRLFVDMDGTLAEWRNIKIVIDKEEDATTEYFLRRLDAVLYSPHYYYRLNPMPNVVEAIRRIVEMGEIEVFVLSCVKKDAYGQSPLADKNAWLDKYLPEIDKEHRIFVPDGENKTLYVPGGLRASDGLLDDYTKNLREWEAAKAEKRKTLSSVAVQLGRSVAIKLSNPVNSSKGTWKGNKVSYQLSPDTIAAGISDVIFSEGLEEVRHQEPDKDRTEIKDTDFLNGLEEEEI